MVDLGHHAILQPSDFVGGKASLKICDDWYSVAVDGSFLPESSQSSRDLFDSFDRFCGPASPVNVETTPVDSSCLYSLEKLPKKLFCFFYSFILLGFFEGASHWIHIILSSCVARFFVTRLFSCFTCQSPCSNYHPTPGNDCKRPWTCWHHGSSRQYPWLPGTNAWIVGALCKRERNPNGWWGLRLVFCQKKRPTQKKHKKLTSCIDDTNSSVGANGRPNGADKTIFEKREWYDARVRISSTNTKLMITFRTPKK